MPSVNTNVGYIYSNTILNSIPENYSITSTSGTTGRVGSI